MNSLLYVLTVLVSAVPPAELVSTATSADRSYETREAAVRELANNPDLLPVDDAFALFDKLFAERIELRGVAATINLKLGRNRSDDAVRKQQQAIYTRSRGNERVVVAGVELLGGLGTSGVSRLVKVLQAPPIADMSSDGRTYRETKVLDAVFNELARLGVDEAGEAVDALVAELAPIDYSDPSAAGNRKCAQAIKCLKEMGAERALLVPNCHAVLKAAVPGDELVPSPRLSGPQRNLLRMNEQAIKEYRSDRKTILLAIRHIGPDAAVMVPDLIPLLARTQPYDDIQMLVVDALGAIGPKASDALPILRTILAESSNDRESRQVEAAIAKIGNK